MDPLSISAGVASLLQVSGTISKYCVSAAHGRKSCERLQRELESTRVVLEHVQDSAFRQSKASQNIIGKLGAPHGPLEQLQKLLASLDKSLARFQKGPGLLRWPFHEREIQASIDLLHRLKTIFIWAQVNESASLTDAVHADLQDIKRDTLNLESRLGALQESIGSLATGLKTQTLFYQGIRRDELLHWLSEISASEQQTDRYRSKLKEHCNGTCEWILHDPTYVEWQSGNSPTNTLVCRGPPGSGKSVFSAFVTMHLQRLFHDQSTLTTGLFCDRNDPQESSYGLLSSVLQGLLSQVDELPPNVQNSFLKHRKRRSNPSFIELQDLIRGTFAHCDRAFIVIDAFDACSIETRTEITKTLRDIHDHVSLLYTCQNSGNLNKLLPVEAILEISAADRDVRQYVLSRIDQSHTLQERVSGDIRLLDEICNAVMDTCRGIFLIARLHMDNIVQSERKKELEYNLRKLPSTVDTAYEVAITRINPKHRELALRVLMWVVFAREPITASRLRHALCVEQYHTRFQEDDTYSVTFLLEICNGLVIVVERGERVELVHFSLSEFLKARSGILFPGSATYLAQTCLRCVMSYDLIDSYNTYQQLCNAKKRAAVLLFPPYDERVYFKRSMSLGFVGYAIRHGISHAAASNRSGTKQLLRRLFDGSTFFAHFSELYVYLSGVSRRERLNLAPYITHYNELCLSVCLGLSPVTQWLLLKGASPNDASFSSTDRISPLALAALYNDATTALELIKYGADPDLPSTFPVPSSRNGRALRLRAVTPLEVAAMQGSVLVMNILIDSGSICDSQGRNESPLLSDGTCAGPYAPSRGRCHGSANDSSNSTSRFQRSSCPTTGSPFLVTMDDDSDLDTRSLPCCARSRHQQKTAYNEPFVFFLLRHCNQSVCSTLNILLDEGLIETNVFDKYSNTPLHALTTNYARLGNPHSVARAFLQGGADPNVPDCKGRISLHLAASLNLRNLAHILITFGARKNVRDRAGKTPLDVANEISPEFSKSLTDVPERPPEESLPKQTAFFDDTTSGKSPVSATFDVVSLYETDEESKEPESVFSRPETSVASSTSYDYDDDDDDDEVDFLSVREVMEKGKRYRDSRMTWGRR